MSFVMNGDRSSNWRQEIRRKRCKRTVTMSEPGIPAVLSDCLTILYRHWSKRLNFHVCLPISLVQLLAALPVPSSSGRRTSTAQETAKMSGAAIRDGGERLKPPLSPVRDAMGDLMSRLQFITSRIPSHRGGSAAGLTISSPI
jgi:hypothetical protein